MTSHNPANKESSASLRFNRTESRLDAPQQHAAGIFPVYPGGAILLQLRDDRPDVAAPNRWSTVGGHIEPGETPPEAAAREMEEETGRRPMTVIPAGYLDHPSSRTPDITVRSHLFATPAPWLLDDIILGEGQRLYWFTPAEIPTLPLAPALAPAILGFLGSDIHRTLAGNLPPATPPLGPPLPDTLPDALGIRPGSLIAVDGISAGFVRRLANLLPHAARITASPGPTDRPDVILWQPRAEILEPALAAQRAQLAPDGRLVVLPAPSTAKAALNLILTAGFTEAGTLVVPDELSVLIFLAPAPATR